MRRDEKGSQSQGQRTVFKTLKEWYRKTAESHERHYGGFHMFGPMKEALRTKDATKYFFFLKKVTNL
jgi:hypothetical protein